MCVQRTELQSAWYQTDNAEGEVEKSTSIVKTSSLFSIIKQVIRKSVKISKTQPTKFI